MGSLLNYWELHDKMKIVFVLLTLYYILFSPIEIIFF